MKKLITSGIMSLAMASALMAAEGDIVFVIDESGSMGPRIQTVIDNVGNLINALDAENVDYQLGLVGFGSYNKGNPRVVTKLTDDATTFTSGLQALLPVGGGYEPGFSAVQLAMSADMEPEVFRPDAGTCMILISDEQAELNDPTSKAEALTALSSRDAIFYGIVNLSDRVGWSGLNTTDQYGPNPGSLSAETGGAVWDIADLGPAIGPQIIQEVIEKCISEAIIPEIEVAFDVHPQSCPNPINTKSKGVTPVAILGTADFDVNDINTSTLLVNGYPVTQIAYEDVAEPYTGERSEEPNRNECWEYEAIVVDKVEIPYAGDGYMDLTFKLSTALVSELTKGVQNMNITGLTNDGTAILGSDVVWVK